MNTQMNIRIDSQIKQGGDEVFSLVGLTPTQVVRSMWEFAAAHRSDPEVVRELFATHFGQIKDTEKQLAIQELDEAASLCTCLRERFGISAPDHLEELDYEALREQAAYDRLAERGLA